MPSPFFQIHHTDPSSAARTGTFQTAHGAVQTPIFMPVGTVGSVKAVTHQQLREQVNAEIILGNTYHLYLRPGTDVLRAAGGLHGFSGWDRPLLTDSGGFQVFSLSGTRSLDEEGVKFRSHIDGSLHRFTPESVMDVQRIIGADIIMAFDECPPASSDHRYAEQSMHLTHRWLDRCIRRLSETDPLYGYEQRLFPIVQGGVHPDLRKESCAFVQDQGLAGHAIGGLSVGEPTEVMYDICGLCCTHLPADKPRYLMGVGTPWNLLECIALGVDMFDCVMPTRNGRNAMLFTADGVINIDNKKWEYDFSPIDEKIGCSLSATYSKAYLRHLFKAGEYLAYTLASVHNLSFYLWLVGEARNQIRSGTYLSWKREMTGRLQQRL